MVSNKLAESIRNLRDSLWKDKMNNWWLHPSAMIEKYRPCIIVTIQHVTQSDKQTNKQVNQRLTQLAEHTPLAVVVLVPLAQQVRQVHTGLGVNGRVCRHAAPHLTGKQGAVGCSVQNVLQRQNRRVKTNVWVFTISRMDCKEIHRMYWNGKFSTMSKNLSHKGSY